MKLAVDLLWVRPNKVGGTEFYIRNILSGLMKLEDDFEVVLLLSRDNADTFDNYFSDVRFKKIICNVESANVWKRVLWQNIHMIGLLEKNGISLCFEPVYSKPFLKSKQVKFITTIHDLQAYHYPEYQNRLKVLWLKVCWRNTVKTSDKIIAISEFVREDILKRYRVPSNKVITIYNAIKIDTSDIMDFSCIGEKHNIEPYNFYYTVSSLAPHKNLITLLNVMKAIKENNLELPKTLLISGVNGRAKSDINSLIEKYGLENNVKLTGFVEDAEKNTLYKYCQAFLFPSIFEGFGMPPIEAMAFGAHVVTTKKTSLFEVTQGKAEYVDNPYDINEWIGVLNRKDREKQAVNLSVYAEKDIAAKYYNLFISME